MPDKISFGTDGWRSIIADGFTFDNLKRITQATCSVLRDQAKNKTILIGYDRRFFSERFANVAARVAQGNGFKVEMTNQALSSPALSIATKDRKAAGGIMITASHNPATFNGFKLKGPQGGSVSEDLTQSIENRLDTGDIQWSDNAPKTVDFTSGYFSFLKKYVPLKSITALKNPIVFDAMHGPGGELFSELAGTQKNITIIRSESDPLFGGVSPEPIERNLDALKEAVKSNKASAGFAVDGDADRIGVIDDKGRYLPPHTVMPLLLLHLIENRKLKGRVLQTVSMGYLPGRIATHFKMPFEEVPVGFKNIASRMHKEKILFGGEESGGYGIGLWFPERDGILCTLLLIEMMAMKKASLSQLVDDLYKRFGASHFERVDFKLATPINKPEWTERIKTNLGEKIAGHAIKSVNTIDGVKIVLDNDAWVLMRPSGTEPLIRTYSEGEESKVVAELLKEADRLSHLPPPKPPRGSGSKKSGTRKGTRRRTKSSI